MVNAVLSNLTLIMITQFLNSSSKTILKIWFLILQTSKDLFSSSAAWRAEWI